MKKEETIFCVPHQCLIKGLTGRGRFVTHYFGEPLKIFPVPRVVEKEKKNRLVTLFRIFRDWLDNLEDNLESPRRIWHCPILVVVICSSYPSIQ